MKSNKTIVFDLDGTLLNTSIGIFNSVRYAEAKMELHPISSDQLGSFIGPPPSEMYQKHYSLSESEALEATAFHREYATTHGVYESFVYNGVIELIELLKIQGFNLAVATLKSQNLAVEILEHHNIANYFEAIVGIDQSESLTKADTIKIALTKMNIENANDVIMIGDSIYDAMGANEVGCKFIGVLYGFGFNSKREYTIDENVLGYTENVSDLKDLLINLYSS